MADPQTPAPPTPAAPAPAPQAAASPAAPIYGTPNPPDNQGAAPPLPLATPNASQLTPGQIGLDTTTSVGTGGVTMGVTGSAGLFQAGPVSGSVQVGGFAGIPSGVTAQAQQTIVVNSGDTHQTSVILTENGTATSDHHGAAGGTVGAEHDFGGNNPNRPRHQVAGAFDAGYVRGAVGNGPTGDGHMLGASASYTYNAGNIAHNLNAPGQIGVELRGTQTDISRPGGTDVDRQISAAVAAGIFTTTADGHVIGARASIAVGDDHTEIGGHGSDRAVVTGTVGIGFSLDAVRKSHPTNTEPKYHIDYAGQSKEIREGQRFEQSGAVRSVDPENDRIVQDIGRGQTAEYRISELRKNSDMTPQQLNEALQPGHRLEISIQSDGSNTIIDRGLAQSQARTPAPVER
jgi:hypothetical protein